MAEMLLLNNAFLKPLITNAKNHSKNAHTWSLFTAQKVAQAAYGRPLVRLIAAVERALAVPCRKVNGAPGLRYQ